MQTDSIRSSVLAVILPFAFAATAMAGVSSTSFTYQGQLKRDGVPVTDTCDMRFKLRTDPNAMDETGVIATLLLDGSGPEGGPVEIRNGLFSAELDFGPSPSEKRPSGLMWQSDVRPAPQRRISACCPGSR